jgi:hypothetical protein
MKGRTTAVFLAFVAFAVMAITALMLFKGKSGTLRNQALERRSMADDDPGDAGSKRAADAAFTAPALHPGPVSVTPEPPAKPWKCTFHEKLPDHLKEQPPRPKITTGDQSDTISKLRKGSFRAPEIRIPFGEFEHVIRLNDTNVMFVWAATERTLSAIDLQHHRVVQPVFGPVEEPGDCITSFRFAI